MIVILMSSADPEIRIVLTKCQIRIKNVLTHGIFGLTLTKNYNAATYSTIHMCYCKVLKVHCLLKCPDKMSEQTQKCSENC